MTSLLTTSSLNNFHEQVFLNDTCRVVSSKRSCRRPKNNCPSCGLSLRLLVPPPAPTSWGSACPSSSSWGTVWSTLWPGTRWRRSACRGSSRSTARSAPTSPTPPGSWVSVGAQLRLGCSQRGCLGQKGLFSSLDVGIERFRQVFVDRRSSDDYLVLISNELKLHNRFL